MSRLQVPRITGALLAAADGVVHGFFGRAGGVSVGGYGELNCSRWCGDDAAAVAANLARAGAALGVARVVTCRQVHGCRVRRVAVDDAVTTDTDTDTADITVTNATTDADTGTTVDTGTAIGTGTGTVTADTATVTVADDATVTAIDDATVAAARIFAGDALVTAVPGVAVGVLGADCAPLLLADPAARVVGAAHAGWRGALAGVAEAAVAEMLRLGARPAGIVCAIGPAIQVDSYRVGDDWARRFRAASPVACDDCFRRGGGGDGARARFRHPRSLLSGGGDGDAPPRHPRVALSGGGDGAGDTGDRAGPAWHFDLPAYLRLRLTRAGVAAIDTLPNDTFTDAQFFSHRRAQGQPCGRQLSAIALR